MGEGKNCAKERRFEGMADVGLDPPLIVVVIVIIVMYRVA